MNRGLNILFSSAIFRVRPKQAVDKITQLIYLILRLITFIMD